MRTAQDVFPARAAGPRRRPRNVAALPAGCARARLSPLLPGNPHRHGRRAGAVREVRLPAAVRSDGHHRSSRLQPVFRPRLIKVPCSSCDIPAGLLYKVALLRALLARLHWGKPMNVRQTVRNARAFGFALLACATLSGCLSAKMYVDPKLPVVSKADMPVVPQPRPVQVLFEFRTKGNAN